MAGFDSSRGVRLRLLGRFVVKTWRETNSSLRTGAWVLWTAGGVLAVTGVFLDVLGWWSSLPFLTNLLTTVTGGLFGVPIVVLLIQRLSKDEFETHVAEELRQLAERQEQLLALRRRAMTSLRQSTVAERTRDERAGAEPVPREPIPRDFEIYLRFLDSRMPAATDPDVRSLQTALRAASATVPPRGSISTDAAAAMRTALSLWRDVVRPVSVTMMRADWLELRGKIPTGDAARAKAEIARFSAAIAAARNPDHSWYEQASALVDASGRRTPRRSVARLFEQGRATFEALLELRHALDALKAALTGPAAGG